MGNAIEYECRECTYWEAMHGINGFNFHDEKYRKCSHCTKPMRDRLNGKGIYQIGRQEQTEVRDLV
jgi:predicted nucleic acid-binding Zn ribbon protein